MKLCLGSNQVKLYLGSELCSCHIISSPTYYRSPSHWTASSQEVTLASGITIEILTTRNITADNSGTFDTSCFEFTADCDQLHTICNGAHWGYNSVYGGTIEEGGVVDFYEWSYYEDQEGWDAAGVFSEPNLEAQYIKEHGTYLGSLRMDSSGYWLVY